MAMQAKRYEIEIQVSLQEKDPRGGYGQDRLSISERLHVRAEGFMQVCAVLAQFHDLARKLDEAQAVQE